MANVTTTFSPAAAALRDGGLVFSFNGAGFLIFFYVGVLKVLEKAGVAVAGGATPMGGVSAGSIAAASFQSGLSHAQRLAATTALNDRCRPSNGCPGRLGVAVREELERFFPPDAYKRAAPPATALFVSKIKGNATAVAAAKPNALLLPAVKKTISYANQSVFLDGVAATAYIPKWSGPARFTVYMGEAVYDGGPTAGGRSCPPPPPGLPKGAATHCVRIDCLIGTTDAFTLAPSLPTRRALSAPAAKNASAAAAASSAAAAAEADDDAEGGEEEEEMIGEEEEQIEAPPDIYIGMPTAPKLEMPREQMRVYALLTVPPPHVKYLVALGEQAAQAWLDQQAGIAEAAAEAARRRAAAAAAAAAKKTKP